MRCSETMAPARMQRVAIVAPRTALRETLVCIAEAGCVEIDTVGDRTSQAGRRLQRLSTQPSAPALSAREPDLDALEHDCRADLLAGEAQLQERLSSAIVKGDVAGLAGWCPLRDLQVTAERIADAGGALVPLRPPRGTDPPTLLRGTDLMRRSFQPLVRTYGTVPYADLDPTVGAGITYIVMFGVMFGDAGHGALLLAAALLLRIGRPRRLASLRALWPFVAGAGLASMLAGLAYGEFFGPTGVLPTLWLNPLDQPLRLLAVAVGLGAAFLALAYGAGIVNRRRERGLGHALYSASGIAGAVVFLAFALFTAAFSLGGGGFAIAGTVLAVTGLALAGTGFFADTAGGPGGAAVTGVQLFDMVVRIGSNAVSFTRLAAFGLTHAALGGIVWEGTSALAGKGGAALIVAAVVFVTGNALAFALEALIAGVQALRLEFYELFSRVFEGQGRPFHPWHLPVDRTEVA